MFIKLTSNEKLELRNGMPVYVGKSKIAFIQDDFDNNSMKCGSQLYLTDGQERYLAVKESPETIIGMLNDGDFCMYSNEEKYEQIPYPTNVSRRNY